MENKPGTGVRIRSVTIFFLLAAGLVGIFLMNVGFGSSNIGIREILSIVTGRTDEHETAALIIQKIRLPRAVASIAGGAALAISGLLLQTFFNNPIVEPYVLGISSGSMLFVGLSILGGLSFGFARITPMVMFGGAFVGAILVMFIVLFAARRVKSMITLLIIGLMTGYLCGAGVSIMSAFAEKESIARFHIWSMGSFSGFTWAQVRILYVIVLPSLTAAFLLAKPLNALNMGEKYAASMGVNVRFARYGIIFISSVLTAATTAFAGPVAFIGLAAPHICRVIFNTSNSRILIPACILGGALLSGFCDFVARNIISPIELPLSAITAIIGAPLVVWLLTRKEIV
jgi:iron complex transport system permease protein